MFTWICPTCGREVPPSMSECPNCAPKVAAPPPQPQAAPLPPPPPPPQQMAPPPPPLEAKGYAPAPQSAYQQQPAYQQPPTYQQPQAAYTQPVYPPPPAQGLPSWLVTLLVFGGLLGLGAAFYFWYLPSSRREKEPVAEQPATADPAKPAAKPNPLTKNLEIAGLRVSEDARQKIQVRMIVINHSAADMGDVKLNITLTSNPTSGAPSVVATFPLAVSDLGPMEAKEVKGAFNTKLRAYEVPDWQFLKATAEILEK